MSDRMFYGTVLFGVGIVVSALMLVVLAPESERQKWAEKAHERAAAAEEAAHPRGHWTPDPDDFPGLARDIHREQRRLGAIGVPRDD